jgi:hypothetical protein
MTIFIFWIVRRAGVCLQWSDVERAFWPAKSAFLPTFFVCLRLKANSMLNTKLSDIGLSLPHRELPRSPLLLTFAN